MEGEIAWGKRGILDIPILRVDPGDGRLVLGRRGGGLWFRALEWAGLKEFYASKEVCQEACRTFTLSFGYFG